MKARHAIALDDVDDLGEFREVVAGWQRLGGRSEHYAGMIAERLARLPDERLARRDAALRALAAHYRGTHLRTRAREMASALLRYELGRWRTERMATQSQEISGSLGAALFAVMKNSPGSGAPRERTIRAVLGKTLPLSVAHDRSHHLIRSEETDGV